METIDNAKKTVHLPVFATGSSAGAAGATIDIDAELAKFEAEEKKRLGLEEGKEHWRDPVATAFLAKDRAHTTLLVCGLTVAHDHFLEAGLVGIGYKVKRLDVPDNDALRFGKEFGNRGQCNPTYFTVGNLVKYLTYLRDEQGLATKDIVDNYVFLTAGACGPCRFGMYATEYRKALRDAGFDGFRVLLFQQQGGLKQATGDEAKPGLEMNPKFFVAILKALLSGDVLNAVAYRIRPYEVVPGSTDDAVVQCKRLIYSALAEGRSIIPALLASRRLLAKVEIDRSIVKPKVSVIGEFWAMTTEGDGNYHLQKFLEQEGAEVDIQLVAAWILFMVWENVYDTKERMELRGKDTGRKSIQSDDPWFAKKKLAKLWAADKAVRAIFQSFAWMIGLEGYHLPDMDALAEEAAAYYNLNVRGGEAHMEVGKLVITVKNKKANMVLSVKPFGCMPSSGVSDGVQSIITEKHPDAIFLPIETSGDGAVNVYSRVQMMLFKARRVAREELEATMARTGMSPESVQAIADKLPWLKRTLHHSPHSYQAASSAANYVIEAARWQKRLGTLTGAPKAAVRSLASAPGTAAKKLMQLAASF
jgi:predicted nucleotide-binding protein (sugar kinase/HSP70/actin superfamily)